MSAELKDVLAMVLTEASKTIISISFSLGNLATDLLTTYRVVFEDIVKSENYRGAVCCVWLPCYHPRIRLDRTKFDARASCAFRSSRMLL